MSGPEFVLVADIGGTHARFALVGADGEAVNPLVLRCADYEGPAPAIKAYLADQGGGAAPRHGAFAVASVIDGDRIELTNSPWRFSIDATRQALGLERLEVVNDFTAVALSVRHLKPTDLLAIGGGAAEPGLPIAVLGPGTGLGVSALIPSADGEWTALATEGGHVTMAAATEREARILDRLRSQFDHVSAERVLSGPGLVNLHCALRGLSGLGEESVTPAELSRRALSGDPLASEALEMFFAMLGTVAGNLALSLGARGGVVIAGGIVPQLLPAFLASGFRRRFEEKGRFDGYLSAIPVQVTIHPYPAFVGLAGLIDG